MDENTNPTDDGIPKMPAPYKRDDESDDQPNGDDPNLAAELIRKKLKKIYGEEPEADEELAEIKTEHHKHSKHQKYILELQNSGDSEVEIQTKWHEYYMSLPNSEKNEVWKEFYAANKQLDKAPHPKNTFVAAPTREEKDEKDEDEDDEEEDDSPRVIERQFNNHPEPEEPEGKKTAAALKRELLTRVKARHKSTWYQRFNSLLFGLGVGVIVLVIFLFSFFNDRFIAPFITPSQNVSDQSIIINQTGGTVGPNPQIIIPKINVEIPVIYTDPTINENQIENNLEDGTVHFPTTAYPGQDGNGAIFGHSSNNILNPGKYKFAFVLLHDLDPGDTFTLDYQGTAYVYQIFSKQIVSPNDVNVLNDIPGHTATFTLITCDPPGTSINRLVVVGDQISPAVSTNTTSTNQNSEPKPSTLPSNSPSLWSRVVKLF